MVFIEERIDQLEKTVKLLSEQLEKVMEDKNDKKRKADVVTQEHLDRVVQELQGRLDTKISVDNLDKSVEEAIEKAKEKDSTIGKVVNEERLAKAVAGMQTAIDVKIGSTVNREQFVQSVATLQQANAQKVSQQQLTQVQTAILQKVQEVAQLSSGLRLALEHHQQQFNRVQGAAVELQMLHQWQTVDPNDQQPFDINKVYRIRIGDGAGSRWLYSNDVSAGHVYTSCNILDQSICVNANTKMSYAARKLGADVGTTAYFAVFQLQCRSS